MSDEFEKKVENIQAGLSTQQTSDLVEIIAIFHARGFYPAETAEAAKRELDRRIPMPR